MHTDPECEPGEDIFQAGFTGKEAKDAGYRLTDMKEAGYTATACRDAGFSTDELFKEHYSCWKSPKTNDQARGDGAWESWEPGL